MEIPRAFLDSGYGLLFKFILKNILEKIFAKVEKSSVTSHLVAKRETRFSVTRQINLFGFLESLNLTLSNGIFRKISRHRDLDTPNYVSWAINGIKTVCGTH